MNYQLYEIDLSFPYHALRVFIPVTGTLLAFIIFWFSWQSPKLKAHLITQNGYDLGWAKLVIYTKILGGLCMGLLPALAYLIAFPETQLQDFGWALPETTRFATFLWIFGLSTLMVFLIQFNAKKPENLEHYPQIRANRWTPGMVRGSLLGWTVYLLGYEALFRGVLLFPLVNEIGLWPAIAINIGLYSATHIPKGLKETIGAIPLCVVLCLLSVLTGNIWIAVAVHVSMAWTNVLVSLKYHPEMKVVKS